MVDILLATYNGARFIEEQIESILNQTNRDFRLIISDDCSTDSTFNIVKLYAEKDKRIKIFRQEINLGVIKNFEFLLEQVTSEYFMFSDQDDIWKKDKLEKSLKVIEESKADLVYSDLAIINDKGEVVNNSYWDLKQFSRKVKKYNNYESLFLNNYITGCTMLVRSKFIKQTTPHILPFPKGDKYMLHDYWTALIVSIQGKMQPIFEPLIYYRQHENNQVGSKNVSTSLNTFEDVRELFINVKLNRFKTYGLNRSRLKKNVLYNDIDDFYRYFEKLSKIVYGRKDKSTKITRQDLKLFNRLYKYEAPLYRLKNLVILNYPSFGRFLYNVYKSGR